MESTISMIQEALDGKDLEAAAAAAGEGEGAGTGTGVGSGGYYGGSGRSG